MSFHTYVELERIAWQNGRHTFKKDSLFLRTYNIVQLNHLGMTCDWKKGPGKGLALAHFFRSRGLHVYICIYIYISRARERKKCAGARPFLRPFFQSLVTRPKLRLRLSYTIHVLPQVIHLSFHPHSLDAWLTYANSGHSYFTQQRSFVNFSWRPTTDEDHRCGRIFWTLYIFYWIKVFFKLLFAVSLSDLFIAIQYAVFRKSVSTSTYHYIYIDIYITYCILRLLSEHIIGRSKIWYFLEYNF